MAGEFIGSGWGFPLSTTSTGGIALVSGNREIEEAIRLILSTAYGERPGNTLEAREVHVWHFADGKATEFWSPSDQQRQIDFFFS